MLAYAQSKLSNAGLENAQVRHGDLYALSLADSLADAIVMHQVLHFLSEPALSIREAARVLAPGGQLLIVDFAPHDQEMFREQQAHERLGFANEQVNQWLKDAGLDAVSSRNLEPAESDGTQKLTVFDLVGPPACKTLGRSKVSPQT